MSILISEKFSKSYLLNLRDGKVAINCGAKAELSSAEVLFLVISQTCEFIEQLVHLMERGNTFSAIENIQFKQ